MLKELLLVALLGGAHAGGCGGLDNSSGCGTCSDAAPISQLRPSRLRSPPQPDAIAHVNRSKLSSRKVRVACWFRYRAGKLTVSGDQLLEDGRPVVLHGGWVVANPSQVQHVEMLPSPPLPAWPARVKPPHHPAAAQLSLLRWLPLSLPPACCLFSRPTPSLSHTPRRHQLLWI